ncbi:hypothetical protein HHL25_14195 [Rhizobium sp. S-51]|uniref:Uncharacterized protein n=1 Tax=Rhizobium terricola TaxID=2728849 RepID=A0A7Y0AXH1_9HYPH|nr:hypothetical protein [Rhizobium terricola]NML75278.1 hypothetical protein [Rhizobium terricola]
MAKLGGQIKDMATEIPVSIDEIDTAFDRGAAAAGIPLDELKDLAKLHARGPMQLMPRRRGRSATVGRPAGSWHR